MRNLTGPIGWHVATLATTNTKEHGLKMFLFYQIYLYYILTYYIYLNDKEFKYKIRSITVINLIT